MPGPVTRVGISVGGTHTDFCLFDAATGETFVHKTHSRPNEPVLAIRQGLEELVRLSGISVAQITELVHSTTLPLELMQARKGSKVGLLVTKGFEQLLHLAHAPTHDFYDTHGSAQASAGEPLADLALTRGVIERVSPTGDTLVPIDETAARVQVRELLDEGAESISICLVHAYANPAHEKRLKDVIRTINETVPVILSSELSAEAGEQARAFASVVNAYVRPGASHYLRDLLDELRSMQMAVPMSMMQSSGSLFNVDQAMDLPVFMMSGPSAASAMGSACVAKTAGFPDALALDMGGTSAEISLIRKGSPRLSNLTRLATTANAHGAQMSLAAPALDVKATTACGSSIAAFPAAGAMSVGPQSAGAHPGPACYGFGATQPTVTDAQLLLGRLRASGMPVDVHAAENAIARLAQALGIDKYRAAQGIIDIANEHLAGPLRSTALEKGIDPATLALLASGGAGPMHGCALSLLTGCHPVVVPRAAGVVAALGLTQADHARQFSQTVGRVLSEISNLDTIVSLHDQLQSQANAWLGSQQTRADANANAPLGHIQTRAELRYWRGEFQISVPVEPSQLTHQAGVSSLAAQLGQAYQRRFGVTPDDQAVELVSLRAIATIPANNAELQRFDSQGSDSAKALVEHAQVYFDGSFTKTAVYSRERLQAGNRIIGPAIVTQADTTTVINPGFVATVDPYLNLVIQLDESEPGGGL